MIKALKISLVLLLFTTTYGCSDIFSELFDTGRSLPRAWKVDISTDEFEVMDTQSLTKVGDNVICHFRAPNGKQRLVALGTTNGRKVWEIEEFNGDQVFVHDGLNLYYILEGVIKGINSENGRAFDVPTAPLNPGGLLMMAFGDLFVLSSSSFEESVSLIRINTETGQQQEVFLEPGFPGHQIQISNLYIYENTIGEEVITFLQIGRQNGSSPANPFSIITYNLDLVEETNRVQYEFLGWQFLAIHNNMAYVNRPHTISAIDLITGIEAWNIETPTNGVSKSNFKRETMFFQGKAYDANTGIFKWDNSLRGPMFYSGGIFWVYNYNPQLIGVDANTGIEIDEISLPSLERKAALLYYSGGLIFLPDENLLVYSNGSNVYAYDWGN